MQQISADPVNDPVNAHVNDPDPVNAHVNDPDPVNAQTLLGHKSLNTTMIYAHVLNRCGGQGVRSPADALETKAVDDPTL